MDGGWRDRKSISEDGRQCRSARARARVEQFVWAASAARLRVPLAGRRGQQRHLVSYGRFISDLFLFLVS